MAGRLPSAWHVAAAAALATSGFPGSALDAQLVSQSRSAFTTQPISAPALPQESAMPSWPRIAVGSVAATAVAAVAMTSMLSECYDYDCLAAVALGLVLEPIAIPLGAHLANRGRGRMFPGVMGSYMMLITGGLVGGLLEGSAGPDAWPYVVGGTVVLQNFLAIYYERHTTPQPEARP